MDQSKIPKLIECASSSAGLTEARRQAAEALGVSAKPKPITNGCAATLSALMQLSGISIPMTLGAGKLANRLGGSINSRRWESIAVGHQHPGDVGVTFDNGGNPGADHIYLVLKRLNADDMMIADNQDKVPHKRAASGKGKTPTDYFLRATPDAPAISALALTTLEHLSSPSGLALANIEDPTIAEVVKAANQSKIAKYNWKDRGVAALGYTAGMAVAYGQRYRKLLAGDVYAVEMSKEQGAATRDALAWYADTFKDAGFAAAKTPTDRLRRLFVLMVGLGMRESSGSHCVGRDKSANNTTAETAEAGLFQMSWNSRSMSPLLPLLFEKYTGRTDLLEIFKAKCSADDLKNWGKGDGAAFQKLSKECPAFAIDFAAIGLRNRRSHWGPINKRAAEIRPDCDVLLRQVESIVDKSVVDQGS
jgi:hypothetical protein